MNLQLSAWYLLALSIPVLIIGEWTRRRISWLDHYNIPMPVVGGLLISFLFLTINLSGTASIKFFNKVDAAWWTWLVTPEPEWIKQPEKGINLPFLIGFFTCIGLNATWGVLRKGSWQIPIFLMISTTLAVMQNALGVTLARAMGENPLLGLICGSLSLTGGHGTALGFADTLVKAGFAQAASVGAAAATFGLIFGSLVGGPLASRLIKCHDIKTPKALGTDRMTDDEAHMIEENLNEPGIIDSMRALAQQGRRALFHLLLLAFLIKGGAWISWGLQQAGLVFPAYMGALVLGLAVRNTLELCGCQWIDSALVNQIGGVLLAIFLAMAMMSLDLLELATSALPMLVILLSQVLLISLFAYFITYRFMGRDYDAAVMASGLCGFGLGATSNAVANMNSIAHRFGPAHRAFIIVPTVGGMFVDITNAINITWFINWLG